MKKKMISFAEWIVLREEGLGANAVAQFVQPVVGDIIRRSPKKKKKEEKEDKK